MDCVFIHFLIANKRRIYFAVILQRTANYCRTTCQRCSPVLTSTSVPHPLHSLHCTHSTRAPALHSMTDTIKRFKYSKSVLFYDREISWFDSLEVWMRRRRVGMRLLYHNTLRFWSNFSRLISNYVKSNNNINSVPQTPQFTRNSPNWI